MPADHQPLFSTNFLRAHLQHDFDSYLNERDGEVLEMLRHWADKDFQKETTAEGAFTDLFFKKLWGYVASGERPRADGFTIHPKFPVPGAGQEGGTGEADLAAGCFGMDGVAETAQVLCEFKDVRSGLDQPQNRKGNNRSPVKQCFDYLKHVARPLYGHEPIQPAWGLVTDMNEFRLYNFNIGPSQYQRFVIRGNAGSGEPTLLGETQEAAFERFLFVHLCHSEQLISRGGPSPLAQLLTNQWVQEKALEKEFYEDYHTYRDAVFKAIVEANPNFAGTKGKLVRLTQRFLDRCIFILYCEDMGETLNYPPSLLRDLLQEISTGRFYNPDDDAAWDRIRQLFVSMRDGTPFGDRSINRFNGGLFEDNPDLDGLRIPTKVFCTRNQTTPEELAEHKDTLLYFSASYNFGMRDESGEKAIDLYTLGRIFEQSITDLEKMEAEADDRVSLMKLSKRKSDGVYYTPEWVTYYIVQETVGARVNDIKSRYGLLIQPDFDRKLLSRYDNWKTSKRKKAETGPSEADLQQVYRYEQALITFQAELESLKVVDPACGSGAFLIQAFDYLMVQRRWIADEQARLKGQQLTLFDTDATMRSILANNIYGVDINQESVEITRLALWLRTALPDRPLTSLDNNIRWGNSLVGHAFYRSEQGQFDFSADERERINTFDWEEAFPEVYARRGFDCVIGNPPYVKLQHFRVYQPHVADYLTNARDGDHPLYRSTQTGSFDLYLAFIEKGMRLLNERGRMGYIAPSLWPLNNYGEGLRLHLLETRQLDRWIDFKYYQVFDEAITYTALQFFRGEQARHILYVACPKGEKDIASVEWDRPHGTIPYEELPNDDAWIFQPDNVRALMKRLQERFVPLGDESWTKAIFQGIKTSADPVYVLQRLGPNRYLYEEKEIRREVPIEDELCRPIAAGAAVKRFTDPLVSEFLLFPYDQARNPPRLYSPEQMNDRFPMAWEYLQSHEKRLREREDSEFDEDESWHAFSRPQNLDKQLLPKLLVAGTAPELRVARDVTGEQSTLGGRVYSILPSDGVSPDYLLAVLNSAVANFYFIHRARPKSGGFFDAETQNLRPIPIPTVDEATQQKIVDFAISLRGKATKLRDTEVRLRRCLAAEQAFDDDKPINWLWADIHDRDYWKQRNPERLSGRALTSWAKKKVETLTAAHLQQLAALMRPTARLNASLVNGELTLQIDGENALTIFPEREDGRDEFIAAQWKLLCRSTNVTEAFTAKKLVDGLSALRQTDQPSLRLQAITLDREIAALESEIAQQEAALDALFFDAYELTEEERDLVRELGQSG